MRGRERPFALGGSNIQLVSNEEEEDRGWPVRVIIKCLHLKKKKANEVD